MRGFWLRLLEKKRKFALYFSTDLEEYVRYSGEERPQTPSTLGFFPLDYTSTLGGSLFEHFDKEGIPLKFLDGKIIYFHTKVFTYGLAHWNKFLRASNEKSRQEVLKVCHYILRVTDSKQGRRIFREHEPEKGFIGPVSGAMEQGLATFLLCAGHELTGDNNWLNAARETVWPLLYPDQKLGIRTELKGKIWLDEFPGKGIHVLNGHNDAVIGLWALLQFEKNEEYQTVFDDLIEALEHQVELFSRGWWSNYWWRPSGFNYIASMKYHTIHVFQLQFLSSCSGSDKLLAYSEIFRSWTKSTLSRITALTLLFIYKVIMRIS